MWNLEQDEEISESLVDIVQEILFDRFLLNRLPSTILLYLHGYLFNLESRVIVNASSMSMTKTPATATYEIRKERGLTTYPVHNATGTTATD